MGTGATPGGGEIDMSARTSRRALFGTSAALLVLAAAPAGPYKASELDCELIENAAAIAAIDRQLDKWNKTNAVISDADWQDELEAYWQFADRVAELTARTPEGLQAKARVLRSVHKSVSGRELDRVGEHLCSLVRDMLGEG